MNVWLDMSEETGGDVVACPESADLSTLEHFNSAAAAVPRASATPIHTTHVIFGLIAYRLLNATMPELQRGSRLAGCGLPPVLDRR